MKPTLTKPIPAAYSQNFLRSEILAKQLIQKVGYSRSDLVLEIGAGQGMLTKFLTDTAGTVISFEPDPGLFELLENKFQAENLKLLKLDFLRSDLQRYPAFKVFANIPFFLTSAIVEKLLFEDNQLQEAYLFMELDAADRFIGEPFAREGIVPLLIKPFWELKVVHRFSRADFSPIPDATVVLLRITKRDPAEVALTDKHMYFDFIAYVINLRKAQIKNALLQLFTFTQLKILSKQLTVNLNSKPTELTYQQWLQLFGAFKTYCPDLKKMKLVGAFAKIQRHQRKLNRDKKISY
jgi:23S rRNA (adenine-N6)-dimethyltransferase